MDVGEHEITRRFSKVLRKAQELGLSASDFQHLQSLQGLQEKSPPAWWLRGACHFWTVVKRNWPFVVVVCALVLGFFSCVFLTNWPVSRQSVVDTWFYWNDMNMEEEPCLWEAADYVIDAARPPVSCAMCQDVKSVDRVQEISPSKFESEYAYSGRPVVIVDGTKNWTAPEHFSFKFFQNIYPEDSPVLKNLERQCQFFPYKTNFESLGEVFSMSEDRAQMKEGSEPWYVGWSNCDMSAANVLRQHYTRPYFLPKVAESSRTDWIFMGSPGYGAHMHIDNVVNPSWQAQITGSKLWTLEPPPECYLECEPRIEVTVNPGEIIVLDTNRWFHSTKIVSSEMSITIGSEYD